LPLASDANVLVTGWGDSARLDVVADSLGEQGLTTRTLRANNPTQAVIDTIVADAETRDVVVVLTQSSVFAPTAQQVDLVAALAEADVDVVQVSVRNPYDVTHTAQT